MNKYIGLGTGFSLTSVGGSQMRRKAMGTIELDPRLCHATTCLGRSPKMLIDAQIVGAVAISFEWLAPEADRGERRPVARRVPGSFQPQGRHRRRARVDKEKVRVLTGNVGGCSA
jgi:hypothetical protein